jgi:hypothetical protein
MDRKERGYSAFIGQVLIFLSNENSIYSSDPGYVAQISFLDFSKIASQTLSICFSGSFKGWRETDWIFLNTTSSFPRKMGRCEIRVLGFVPDKLRVVIRHGWPGNPDYFIEDSSQ